MLSLGKMHINLSLSHFKKDHSPVIIQLGVPAIFNPIFSSTLNFSWHQKRGCLSAGCCSLLVFAGIRVIPITWSCQVFLEPVTLPGFHSVWGGWGGTKQSRAWVWPPPGETWRTPSQPTLQGSPGAHSCICSSSLEPLPWKPVGRWRNKSPSRAWSSWRRALLLLPIN